MGLKFLTCAICLSQHKLLMTDVDLSRKEVEVNEMIRKLFR